MKPSGIYREAERPSWLICCSKAARRSMCGYRPSRSRAQR